MGLLGVSIASVLLEGVLPALTVIEESISARRKHTGNATFVHGHPIQRAARLKHPGDNSYGAWIAPPVAVHCPTRRGALRGLLDLSFLHDRSGRRGSYYGDTRRIKRTTIFELVNSAFPKTFELKAKVQVPRWPKSRDGRLRRRFVPRLVPTVGG